MPGTNVRVTRLVNAVLPSHPAAPGEVSTQQGEDVEHQIDFSAHRPDTTLGREAGAAFNQHVSPGQAGDELPCDPDAR